MQERLHAFITTHQLISPNDRVFAAVSGGIDSMVLLDLLRRLSGKFPFELCVLHINHNVRGAASDADEALVEKQAKHYDLLFECKQLSGLDSASSEDTLRQARYGAFEEILLRYPGSKIASAHHLDDQLETFFMRLAKGAGLKGLSSIPVKRKGYIRPLLTFRRSEIEAYAVHHNIPFREDQTNTDITKLRNHIRHTLVPAVKEVFGPSFYNGFSKSLEEIVKHHQLFSKETEQNALEMFRKNGTEGRLTIRDYSQLSFLRRPAVFQYCISQVNPLTSFVSDDLWQAFDRFVFKSSTGARFQAGNTLFVLKNREHLLFYAADPDVILSGELYPNESVSWGKYIIRLQNVRDEKVTLNKDRNQEFFCADRILFPLTVRSWQEGDFFYPLGMKGKKKISDFFVDQKIEGHIKNRIPLVCSGTDIIWVAGMRLDNRFKVNETCKKIYQITIKENKGSRV